MIYSYYTSDREEEENSYMFDNFAVHNSFRFGETVLYIFNLCEEDMLFIKLTNDDLYLYLNTPHNGYPREL